MTILAIFSIIFPWNNAQTGEVYFDVFSEIPSAAGMGLCVQVGLHKRRAI